MKKYYLIFLSLLFIFPISVFAEEEKSNAFYKENIKRALENELDKYDLKFEVENA